MLSKIIFVPFFLFVSCKTPEKMNYGMARKFEFGSKESYLRYLVREKGFPESAILFVDSASYQCFLKDVLIDDGSIAYLGIFLNDSLSIRKSDPLKNEESFTFQSVQGFLNNFNQSAKPESRLLKKIILSHYRFKFLNLNAYAFPVSGNTVPVLILLYSFSYGTYYDKLYREAKKILKKYKGKLELLIILTDEVYNLNY